MLPNLIVAGAQKCGTTSLHYLLASHPRAFFPERPQEIHFFDIEANYRRGARWLEDHFTEWQGEEVVGQTSPLYLFEPAVPERMARLLPAAKLIFILRHPVTRAYSHDWHEVRYGTEALPFEEALAAEPERLAGADFETRRRYSYQARGRYAEQLRRFLDHFPREQVLVLLQDELRADPASLRRRCGEFLGLEATGFAVPTGGRRNPSRLPRWRSLQRWVAPLRRRLPRLGTLVDLVNLRRGSYPPMAEATRRRLQEAVPVEVEALAELGVDARGWLEEP